MSESVEPNLVESEVPAQGINVTPMTEAEAREYTERIRQRFYDNRADLLEMDRRRGWEALGYGSWSEWAISEYQDDYKERYLFRLKAAASVEENLRTSQDESILRLARRLPISQASELAKLPTQDKQTEALKRAEEIAKKQGKARTAQLLKQVIKQIKENEEETTEIPGAWRLSAKEFSIQLSDTGESVNVVYEPGNDIQDLYHHFELQGNISPTGFTSHYVFYGEAHKHVSPQAYAQILADKLYRQFQKQTRTTGSAESEFQTSVDIPLLGKRVVVICPSGYVEMPSAPEGSRGTVQSFNRQKNRYKVRLDSPPAPGKRRDVSLPPERLQELIIPADLSQIKSERDFETYLQEVGEEVIAREFSESEASVRVQLKKFVANIYELVQPHLGSQGVEQLQQDDQEYEQNSYSPPATYLWECKNPDDVAEYLEYSTPAEVFTDLQRLQQMQLEQLEQLQQERDALRALKENLEKQLEKQQQQRSSSSRKPSSRKQRSQPK
ncbi:hypothetical protein IQ258_01045 [Coleofasciculus sp. LEGE 07081]|nr:hypothetical protein [Coleofasciculus sp. LEGE 07081]